MCVRIIYANCIKCILALLKEFASQVKYFDELNSQRFINTSGQVAHGVHMKKVGVGKVRKHHYRKCHYHRRRKNKQLC